MRQPHGIAAATATAAYPCRRKRGERVRWSQSPHRLTSLPTITAVPRSLSPGYAVAALSAGHAAWGAVAYRSELREILQTGVADSVGDGIFRVTESRGPRAAAFWFMMVAPLTGLSGYLLDRAEQAGDGQALRAGGRALGAVAVAGATVMPRSGFLGALPLAYWLERRGRALTRG
jgi:hypothetical protein